MTTEVALFLLRVVSALLLLALLIALLAVMWRDYRTATREVEATRRTYGKLVALREVEGQYVPTGDTYPLLPLTSLGRSPTNTIRIDDSFASGEHALVAMRNGQWWLEDRQSRNGTVLNAVPIKHPVVITDGDVISIGQISYRVELEK